MSKKKRPSAKRKLSVKPPEHRPPAVDVRTALAKHFRNSLRYEARQDNPVRILAAVRRAKREQMRCLGDASAYLALTAVGRGLSAKCEKLSHRIGCTVDGILDAIKAGDFPLALAGMYWLGKDAGTVTEIGESAPSLIDMEHRTKPLLKQAKRQANDAKPMHGAFRRLYGEIEVSEKKELGNNACARLVLERYLLELKKAGIATDNAKRLISLLRQVPTWQQVRDVLFPRSRKRRSV